MVACDVVPAEDLGAAVPGPTGGGGRPRPIATASPVPE